MHCSVCSEIIRPVVAVDIDGTLGDYHGHFINFAEQWIGRELRRDYTGAGGFRYWFGRYNFVGTEEFRAIKLAYRQGGMKRSMPVYEGAPELLMTIIEHDAELWLTTTRPYLSLDTVIPDTVEWLARNGMTEYDGMLFDDDKYAKLLERVDERRVVAVIDDLNDMCDEADKLIGRRVSTLIGTRWNEHHQNWRRSSMGTILGNIGNVIDEWKETYGHIKNDRLRDGTRAGIHSGQLHLLGEVEG